MESKGLHIMSWVLSDVPETRLSTEPPALTDHSLPRDRAVEMDVKQFETILVFAFVPSVCSLSQVTFLVDCLPVISRHKRAG